MRQRMITIYIMGKPYEIPDGLTVMKAMEYTGHKFVRGCGCRGGFCGACGTVYRLPGDYKLKVGLACQMVAEEGMYLTMIPFYPANKALYDIEKVKPTLSGLVQLYPELSRCLGCRTCDKVCPQNLKVMDTMAAAMRGDIAKVANLSFDCIMCGLCASRCPAEIVQYYVSILCRRLYGKYIASKSFHLERRVAGISSGEYDAELLEMKVKDISEIKSLYNSRVIE
ncbi:MAG: NAD(P)H-quinone oxidoreductase subunit I, chloroplastic [candidate division WS2 bacterium]|uniref:NAD(P)H-quinone oxidoreductase subunit I, chloroplastic n=1 Tax=Psychracetigena formicireducens TaxID=2986056 RepID=A0A9E2BGZ9_PSYF1|nr:NAD(P)H-quinone oxidoreductase subunit I, chloroplastic [Candidatus Psychracetigena formicireducens]MBT9144411.1 NAD(P)H-quinone oxidoreductase subunit I, chloroplastic [Candidatus Psychracetigena formicireducens]MBT9150998.1 NAD(P)H-quinone oxidoreductase subunit I, chloroplastic [Candidatus Psychracetigena formicireducens]